MCVVFFLVLRCATGQDEPKALGPRGVPGVDLSSHTRHTQYGPGPAAEAVCVLPPSRWFDGPADQFRSDHGGLPDDVWYMGPNS